MRTLLDTDPTLAAALPANTALSDLSGPARDAAVDVLGQSTLMQLLRQIMLQVIGGLWVEYLTSVEALVFAFPGGNLDVWIDDVGFYRKVK